MECNRAHANHVIVLSFQRDAFHCVDRQHCGGRGEFTDTKAREMCATVHWGQIWERTWPEDVLRRRRSARRNAIGAPPRPEGNVAASLDAGAPLAQLLELGACNDQLHGAIVIAVYLSQ